jgi:regulatory protein YycI of two-component signal transduction system YycFG
VVDLNFGGYVVPNVPLYLVILIPLIIGLFTSLIIHTAKDLSQKLTINEQKDKIKKLEDENAEIVKKLHKQELENTKMKAERGEFDEDSIQQ